MVEELHCSNFEESAILYAAGELTEAHRATLEEHAQQCANCAAVLSREIRLRELLASRMQPADQFDGSELLLARCRSELFETLDDAAAAKSKRAWHALVTPWRWMGAFRRALVFHPGWSTAALLLVGALGGTAAREWYRQIGSPVPVNPVITVSAPAPITQQELETMDRDGIRLERQLGSPAPKVQLQVRSPQPRVVEGTPDDAEIRRVLAYVIGHGGQFNDGVRLDSIDALRPQADDPQVRAAMGEALRHDPNPAVRLRAIEALRGVGSAPDVQNAILGALSDDDNSGVRIQALNTLLERMRSHEFSRAPLDHRAVSILRDRMRNDSNRYIRSRSADALGQLASMDEDSGSGEGRHP
jgi:HEAT repeat protein/putative zinc finger protein